MVSIKREELNETRNGRELMKLIRNTVGLKGHYYLAYWEEDVIDVEITNAGGGKHFIKITVVE